MERKSNILKDPIGGTLGWGHSIRYILFFVAINCLAYAFPSCTTYRWWSIVVVRSHSRRAVGSGLGQRYAIVGGHLRSLPSWGLFVLLFWRQLLCVCWTCGGMARACSSRLLQRRFGGRTASCCLACLAQDAVHRRNTTVRGTVSQKRPEAAKALEGNREEGGGGEGPEAGWPSGLPYPNSAASPYADLMYLTCAGPNPRAAPNTPRYASTIWECVRPWCDFSSTKRICSSEYLREPAGMVETIVPAEHLRVSGRLWQHGINGCVQIAQRVVASCEGIEQGTRARHNASRVFIRKTHVG